MANRKRVKKNLPELPVEVVVDSLTHDGRGVARVDGKVVFIDEALPDEKVAFIYTEIRKDYAEGKVVELFNQSPDRVEPQCPHFSVCGGCSFQHVADSAQITIKQNLLAEQFRRIAKLEIDEFWPPIVGPHWGYRRKARMGVKFVEKKNRVLVGFRERRRQYLAEIDHCMVMHPIVGTRLPALSAMIGDLTIRDKIPQIEVAVGDHQCVLAVRVMETPTEADKIRMKKFADDYGVTLCLQAKGPDTIVPLSGSPELLLTYALPDHHIEFQFRPAMFTQVNSEINRQMINRVLSILELQPTDRVLDLFCGLGNFTLPMARYAGHVVGVEGDQPLIQHAWTNAQYNGIENVEFYAADLSKELDQQSWCKRRYDKILLDPSRAGALEVLRYFVDWQPKRIVYVSCNPSTLARDAGILVHELGYKLIAAGVMDMFPQTAHVESMAMFEK